MENQIKELWDGVNNEVVIPSNYHRFFYLIAYFVFYSCLLFTFLSSHGCILYISTRLFFIFPCRLCLSISFLSSPHFWVLFIIIFYLSLLLHLLSFFYYSPSISLSSTYIFLIHFRLFFPPPFPSNPQRISSQFFSFLISIFPASTSFFCCSSCLFP